MCFIIVRLLPYLLRIIVQRMGGFKSSITLPLLCLLARGFCWTYAVESKVQTCRSALKADSVTAFVTDTHYIIMNDLSEKQGTVPSPPFRRTHTTKISQRLMAELMHHINATVFWPMLSERHNKDNLRRASTPINVKSTCDTAIFLSDVYIPFMFGALTALLIMYLIY